MGNTKSAIAIGAHPDDIEFRMAGTLLLLKQAGYDIHYLNIANGSLGSIQYNTAQTRIVRRREAKRAAKVLGATWHHDIVDDYQILYDLKIVARVCAVIREVRPTILLTHPPVDYMEDHTNACRVAVSAAFVRGAPNFRTNPPRKAIEGEVVIYHCMPHGMRDPLNRRMVPESFIDTTSVHAIKRDALSCHESQAHWLEASQGMNAYVNSMEEDSRLLGRASRRFEYAEGWRRHLHLGFCAENADPLTEALGDKLIISEEYEKSLR